MRTIHDGARPADFMRYTHGVPITIAWVTTSSRLTHIRCAPVGLCSLFFSPCLFPASLACGVPPGLDVDDAEHHHEGNAGTHTLEKALDPGRFHYDSSLSTGGTTGSLRMRWVRR